MSSVDDPPALGPLRCRRTLRLLWHRSAKRQVAASGKNPDSQDGRMHDVITSANPASAFEAATEQTQDKQKYYCTYEGIDDCGNHTCAKMDAQRWQQPVADKGSDKAHDQIADQPKAAALHYSASQPTSDDSNEYDDQHTLI